MYHNHVLKIINFILSVIFPKTCSLCGKDLHFNSSASICSDCKNSLPKLDGIVCQKCSLPLPDGETICRDCKNAKNIYFDVIKSPFLYSGKTRTLIKKFKYSRKFFLAKDLSELMSDFIKEQNIDKETDVIIPVPIHRYKGLLRGFNQAALLAEAVAENINKPVYTKALKRTKYTKPQFKLKKQQRIENLENMFAVNKKYADVIKDKNILLIDDIVTTCSTINQCSKILKEFSAGKITVVSLSRAAY